MSIFHLALIVGDLDKTRAFYGDVLRCNEGRSTKTWVDFNVFGHQISLHLGTPVPTRNTGKVAGHNVPMPHFGVILELDEWKKLADRLTREGMEFILEPGVRFAGEPGEQYTMFFCDPSGNTIEIKGFAHMDGVFAS